MAGDRQGSGPSRVLVQDTERTGAFPDAYTEPQKAPTRTAAVTLTAQVNSTGHRGFFALTSGKRSQAQGEPPKPHPGSGPYNLPACCRDRAHMGT